jgi:catechol 2,3-dioxygenase-like lactoylglutathione lyase family enzyme
MARTIIPAARISQDDAALQAIGFDHIILTVSDLEKSAAWYGKFFGKESGRTKKPERIWFDVARTKLGLEAVAAGKQPSIDHVSVRIAGFDQKTATEKLKKLGAEIVPSNDEGLLRFRDPNGIMLEMKAGA